jgi:hypothetical protein
LVSIVLLYLRPSRSAPTPAATGWSCGSSTTVRDHQEP